MAESARLGISSVSTDSTPTTSPRSSFLASRIFSPLVSKSPLRDDAPWIAFLEARNHLLDAYHALYPAEQLDTTTNTTPDVELRRAFVRFNLALDSISVPHEWWSELPREGVRDEETHAQLLALLETLSVKLRALARDRRSTVIRSLELDDATRWLKDQHRRSRAHDDGVNGDAWPFDGSYPNTPLASPPLFASGSAGSSVGSISSFSTIGVVKEEEDNVD